MYSKVHYQFLYEAVAAKTRPARTVCQLEGLIVDTDSKLTWVRKEVNREMHVQLRADGENVLIRETIYDRRQWKFMIGSAKASGGYRRIGLLAVATWCIERQRLCPIYTI